MGSRGFLGHRKVSAKVLHVPGPSPALPLLPLGPVPSLALCWRLPMAQGTTPQMWKEGDGMGSAAGKLPIYCLNYLQTHEQQPGLQDQG